MKAFTPVLVERNQLFRFRRKPAPRQPAVEILRVLANPFDVVHGEVFPPSCLAKAGHSVHVDSDCLGNVVPDSKACGYWIARLHGR